ncbi:hypothetical protein E2C01_091910 [Portunus trituberculatus]|uniref:Uncharacterized protein n=1 Tax=Portunus trituberculatus TaxID=210409 RepID=A0A5B7JIT2_PORTR|nr:hypothetical protein [Portunus trituberculatus]
MNDLRPQLTGPDSGRQLRAKSQEDFGFEIWEPLPQVNALPNLGTWPGFEPVHLRTLGPTKSARSHCTTTAPNVKLQ